MNRPPVYNSKGQHSKEYKAFVNMRARVLQRSESAKKRWSGSIWDGMELQPEWHEASGYGDFYNHIGPAPEGAVLDRKDNSAGYVKGNVRWATYKVSANNTRRVRSMTVLGVTKNLSEWAQTVGLSYPGLSKKIKASNLTPEEVVRSLL